ncbi:PAS domain S-box-containing protein [Roseiarcus fermentans]|uniref:histidine kinase n=1 Tax=Roseiarcus fermentans TaxID=1473586 RepID=A0A366FW49_9HYPH|nr:PAS domain S-box protein [Roseiarcus fermentans]RBP18250.1 PAS domain S-box-containing protein [Roseiarcus fermentans]
MKDLFLGGRLDAFIQQSSAAMAMFDREMRYLAVSGRWLSDYGLRQSPLGRSHYDIFPEIGEAWKAIHAQCLAGATLRSEGEPFRRDDGAVQWIKWEARPWRDNDGAIAGLILTTEDLTERQEQLAAIERLASIVTSAHDAIVSKDLHSTVTSWNAGAARLFGWSVEDMIGTSILRIIPPERRDEEDRILERIRAGERIDHFETVRMTKDRRRIDVSLTISPIRNALGEIVGASKIVRDVTERRRGETALRRSEVRLKQALAAAKAGEWEVDAASGSFFASDRALALYGLPPGTRLTREDALAAVHPDDRVRVRDALGRAIDEGSPFHSEHRALRRDGTTQWVVSHAEALAKQGPPRLVGLVQDITERKALEAELKETDRRKDEFIALLAHELRNPLAPIQSGVELFKMRDAGGDDRGRALLQIMGRQVDHLVRLVDDLLDVSRVNVGAIALRRRPVSVEDSIADAWSIVAEEAKRKPNPAALAIACDEPLLVDADPVRLTQVFANLLSNAVKYTGDDGRIRVAIERDPSGAAVTVSDNGRGIEPQFLPRVFDAFVRGGQGSARDDSGLGVGLALVKAVVELHGGRVEARSEGLGRGSAFVVRLPLAQSETAPPHPVEAPSPQPKMRSRALVIDDDRDVADSFVMLLQVLEADVRCAYDGASGVALAESFQPHVAFVDLRMPGIDGLETARRLRQRLADRTPLLVAVTGLGQSRDRARSREAGFDLHFTKPVSLEIVQQVLDRLRPDPVAA